MNRILAIEPDAERGVLLGQLVRENLDADVIVAPSSDAAIAAMAERQPDLILTSMLLAASDEQHLVAHLRTTPAARHLPVLTIPAVTEPPLAAARTSGLFSRFRRRQQPQPLYNVNAVITRIEEALEQSRIGAARAVSIDAPAAPEPAARPIVELEPTDRTPPMPVIAIADTALTSPGRVKRARRWSMADVPWLSTVKVPWGHVLRLCNISSSGMLVESGLRLSPGSTTTFQIGGPEVALVVPARVIRCRVTAVDSLGVKYETAAAFERPIDSLVDRDTDPASAAARLADVVASVRERAARGESPASVRTAFEHGVLDLISAHDVRLRDAPIVENDGRESVYFTVPTSDGSRAVLQVIFDANAEPCARDFTVMLAAADAAGGVVTLTDTTKQTTASSAPQGPAGGRAE